MASVLLCGFVTNANAAVIDFNADTSYHYGNGSYIEDGYQIDNSVGQIFWGNSQYSQYNADPGGNTYGQFSTSTLSKIGGGLFTFNSIDIGDFLNGANYGDVMFNFSLSDSTLLTQTVSMDQLVGLETFTFNLLVSKVEWTGIGGPYNGWLQNDNIVVDGNITQTPIPAAVWLSGYLALPWLA